MIAASVLAIAVAASVLAIAVAATGLLIRRREGAVLLAGYVAYVAWIWPT